MTIITKNEFEKYSIVQNTLILKSITAGAKINQHTIILSVSLSRTDSVNKQ